MKRLFKLVLLVIVAVIAFNTVKNKLGAFYYNQGIDLYEKGLYNDAQNSLVKSLTINPDSADAHYVLGNIFNYQKLKGNAIKEYREALRLNNKFIPAYKTLINIYFNGREFAAAQELLDRVKILFPNDPQLKRLQDEFNLGFVAGLLNSGTDSFLKGDKATAYRLVNKAVEVNPAFPFSSYILAYFYYVDNNYDKAQAYLDDVIRQDKEFYPAHKLRGDIYFSKKLFKEAIYEYQAALLINANEPAILNDLALAFMNLESYDDATTFLKKALNLTPENITYRYNLASLYKDSGKLKEAALEYNKVIIKQPDYTGAHNGLGDTYKAQGLIQQAVEQYKKEVSLCQNKLISEPGSALLLASLAHAYNGAGDFVKAKELVEETLAVNPDNGNAYLTLAEIYKNLNKPEEARRALEKAKGLSTRNYRFIESNIAEIIRLNNLRKNR